MSDKIKGSFIIGLALIIAGIIVSCSIYFISDKAKATDTEIKAEPGDYKKIAEVGDKIKEGNLTAASKLLVEFYNERLKILQKHKQTSNRLLRAYEEAIAIVEKDEKLMAQYLFDLGSVKTTEKNFLEAGKFYHEAVRLDPENSIYLNGLGLTYKIVGNIDKSLEYYEKALKIDRERYGENVDVARDINNIGGVWGEKGDYKKALQYYKDAEKILEKHVGNDHSYMKLVRQNIENVEEKMKTEKSNG